MKLGIKPLIKTQQTMIMKIRRRQGDQVIYLDDQLSAVVPMILSRAQVSFVHIETT
jgi:hypothetical protein